MTTRKVNGLVILGIDVKRSKRGFGMAALACAAASGAILLPGCSGSSSSSHAVVRAANAIADYGQLTMIVNAGAVNGTQKYGQTSGYLYFPTDGTSTAAFALTSVTDETYPISDQEYTFNVTGDNPYTLVAYGNPAEPGTSYLSPKILALTDNTDSIPSGMALVRIVDVAPDAGSINYSLAGGAAATVAYGTTSGNATSSYVAVAAGSAVPLAVASASTGTTLISQTLNFAAGNAYTILVSESTLVTAADPTATVVYAPIILNDR